MIRVCGFCKEPGHNISHCTHSSIENVVATRKREIIDLIKEPLLLKEYFENIPLNHLKIVVKKEGGCSSESQKSMIKYLTNLYIQQQKKQQREQQRQQRQQQQSSRRRQQQAQAQQAQSQYDILIEDRRERMRQRHQMRQRELEMRQQARRFQETSEHILQLNAIRHSRKREKYSLFDNIEIRLDANAVQRKKRNNENENNENEGFHCPICLDNNGCNVNNHIKMNCNHEICMVCVNDWTMHKIQNPNPRSPNLLCPLCNTKISSMTSKTKTNQKKLMALKTQARNTNNVNA